MNTLECSRQSRMCEVRHDPYQLVVREFCGLGHETQIVEVPVPDGETASFFMRDENSGRLFPAQRIGVTPRRAYLQLKLDPYETLVLVPAEQTMSVSSGIEVTCPSTEVCRISNEFLELEVPWNVPGGRVAPGPVARFRIKDGKWRGGTFFDVSAKGMASARGRLLESGPLRVVYEYRAEWNDGFFYQAILTLDAGQDFVVVEESFSSGAADQLIWDFKDGDLPREILLLNDTPGYRAKQLQYHYDQRHARLWCWTQYSQLHDLSDGYAAVFPDDNVAVGFVALHGGKWRGNRLNHMEAWTRRWISGDPATRRLPAETKADSHPAPEKIPARGSCRNEAHFSVEGWIGKGSRTFALLVTKREKLDPMVERMSGRIPERLMPVPSHFEHHPDIERFKAHQSRLRKISTQFGVLSLQDQMEIVFLWPLERAFSGGSAGRKLHPIAEEASLPPEKNGSVTSVKEWLLSYVSARVFAFWYAAGPVSTNAVAARALAPLMERLELLAGEDGLSSTDVEQCRAWFALLIHLFASDNYYPGKLTMSAVNAEESSEPTLAGMANQNFYTDVLNIPGMAAQIFSNHPNADSWRSWFLERWRLQLDFHTYPASGLWEESHTYYQHVLCTILPVFARRYEDGIGDEFEDPRLQKMIDALVRQISPRDSYLGGNRHLVAFGDHDAYGSRMWLPLYLSCATALMKHNPALARRICWAYREMGGTGAVLGIEPEPIPWKSESMEGLGTAFRIHDFDGGEGLLMLRCGSAWAHHHQDDGSIQLFGGGRALVVDSAFGHGQVRNTLKFAAAGHSRALPEGIDPFNVFWRFNRGWIVECDFETEMPYAIAFTPTYMTSAPGKLSPLLLSEPILAFRVVVSLLPATFLLIDYFSRPLQRRIRFHVAGKNVQAIKDGVSSVYDGGLVFDIKSPNAPLVDGEFVVNESADRLPETGTTEVDFLAPGGRGHTIFGLSYGKEGTSRLETTQTPTGCVFARYGKTHRVNWSGETKVFVTGEGKELTIDFARHLKTLMTFCLGQ